MYLEDINQYRKLDSDEWVYLAFETEDSVLDKMTTTKLK